MSDIQLTPAEIRRLRDVLNEAYDPDSIERALHYWSDRRLDHYVPANADMREIVYELIREAGSEGWLAELVVCAYCEKPTHGDMAAFFANLRPKILEANAALNQLIQEVEAKQISNAAAQPHQTQSTAKPSTLSTEAPGTPAYEPETIQVPEGPFLMGMRPGDFQTLRMDVKKDELPRYEVFLNAYEIGRYPVTNTQYRFFIEEAGHRAPVHWEGGAFPDGRKSHPVVNVSWEDAEAYALWLHQKTGKDYRLPTEAQWEKAARGTDGRFYPWGGAWKTDRLNSRESRQRRTTHAGQYSPEGDSPYGLADAVGNVREWCANFYAADTYQDHKNARNPVGPKSGVHRVLRGGSFQDNRLSCRCTTRFAEYPYFYANYVGFRIVCLTG